MNVTPDKILTTLMIILVIGVAVTNIGNSVEIYKLNQKLDAIAGFCEHGDEN